MGQFLFRDSKTHERLGESDSAAAGQFGRDRDGAYIDAYPDDDRAKLDAWVEDQKRR